MVVRRRLAGLVDGCRVRLASEAGPAVAARRRAGLLRRNRARALRIVTAADSSHAASLANLAASVHRHEPAAEFVAWDLGLEPDEIGRVRSAHPGVLIRRFPFDREPPHVGMANDAGSFAWKPIIVDAESTSAAGGLVLWLDAGDVILHSLSLLTAVIARDGFYSPHSMGSVETWTHPAMLERFAVAPALRDSSNLSGGIVGVDPEGSGIRALLDAWARCARDATCIAPPGSNRSNHRQDQAALTILARQAGFAVDRPYHRSFGWTGIAIHRDVERPGVR